MPSLSGSRKIVRHLEFLVHRSLTGAVFSLAFGACHHENTHVTPPPAASPPQIATLDGWLLKNQPTTLSPAGVLCDGEEQSGKCSRQQLEVGDDRIVGGRVFDQIEAVGAIQYLDESGKPQPHCSGTLIGPQLVLTAAHCVHRLESPRLKFAIGRNAWAPRATFGVETAISHQDYKPNELGKNDVALVVLQTPVSNADEILLPQSSNDVSKWLRDGRPLAFVGYGYAVNGAQFKYRLGQKARVDISVAQFDAATFTYATPGKNTCNGDSGGPALWFDNNGSVFIVGITSWGRSACAAQGVDVRVDAHLEWIEKHRPDKLQAPQEVACRLAYLLRAVLRGEAEAVTPAMRSYLTVPPRLSLPDSVARSSLRAAYAKTSQAFERYSADPDAAGKLVSEGQMDIARACSALRIAGCEGIFQGSAVDLNAFLLMSNKFEKCGREFWENSRT